MKLLVGYGGLVAGRLRRPKTLIPHTTERCLPCGGGDVSSCRHTLGSTRLTYISCSIGWFSALLLVWVEVDDFYFSISFCSVVCVAIVAWVISGTVVCELLPFVTVLESPKIISGNFVLSVPVIKFLASITFVVGWYCGDDLVFFICLSFVGGRLCHLGSETLFSWSEVFVQSTKTARPRGLLVFRLLGMKSPVKFFASFRLMVWNFIVLIDRSLNWRILDCRVWTDSELNEMLTDFEQSLSYTESWFWIAIDRWWNVWNV